MGREGDCVIPKKAGRSFSPLEMFLNWVLATAGKDLNCTQFLNLSEEA